MIIKVLGSGCAKCNNLYDTVVEIVNEEGLDASVEKVQDIKAIMSFGIMASPGLVIDDEVQFAGTVPSRKKLKKILTK